MKKRLVSILIAVMVMVMEICMPIGALTDVTDIGKKDSLKILAIGNSFSEDSTEYLPWIAKDCGIKEIVVGNMYIGGCTIKTHAENARQNKGAYKYYKNTEYTLMSACPTTANVSLETALKDEKWDVITLQQSSINSGIESYYNSDLDYLVDYVKGFCPDAKIGWHMTWAYDSSCTLSAFKTNYRNNQKLMYEQITSCVEKKIVPNEKFDFIIPAGTAIQNARSGYLGDNLTRDGYHLDLNIGRYIVGVTWMKSLGYSTDSLTTIPRRMKKNVLPFVLECAENALKEPFEVTQSSYTYEPGKKPPETSAVIEDSSDVPESSAVAPVESASDILLESEIEAVTTTSPESETGVNENETDNNKIPVGVIIGIGAAAVAAVGAIIAFSKKKKKNDKQ